MTLNLLGFDQNRLAAIVYRPEDDVDTLQEPSGKGLRTELADAVIADRPVLTAVSEKCFDAWRDFTGDRGTTLLCARRVVDAWRQEVSYRDATARGIPPTERTTPSDRPEITFRSSTATPRPAAPQAMVPS
jgi:hypothetical protein